jgi:hypothetical protein
MDPTVMSEAILGSQLLHDHGSFIVISVLTLMLAHFFFSNMSLSKRLRSLQREIDGQNLDYHLRKLEGLGYTYTLSRADNRMPQTGAKR